jgi:hypothetical protein
MMFINLLLLCFSSTLIILHHITHNVIQQLFMIWSKFVNEVSHTYIELCQFLRRIRTLSLFSIVDVSTCAFWERREERGIREDIYVQKTCPTSTWDRFFAILIDTIDVSAIDVSTNEPVAVPESPYTGIRCMPGLRLPNPRWAGG